MKKLLTLLVAFCCLGSMNAQLVDVIVETFGTSGGTYPAGHTTYRVFARLQDPTDFMSAVYGIGAAPADPDHELRLLDNVLEAGSTVSWNSSFGGVTGPDINPAFCGIFPETCFDSFITIGRANSTDPGNAINVLTTPAGIFNPTLGNAALVGVPCTVNDGAWFALSGDVNGFPTGVDNRVLLMQITCPTGELEYQMNVQVFDEALGANSLYYAHNLQGPMGQVGGVAEQDFTCEGLVWPEPGFCAVVNGCTDITACNYNALATVDDGSCTYPGCNDATACNYDATAGCDDGSCTYPGCIDATACNFDATAGCDDGSCTYPGCTNATACNFDATAGCDDGSCCFENCVNITVTAGSFPSENSWNLADGLGNVVASGAGASNVDLCLVDDCYVFNMFDSFGDSWNGAAYTISINGVATYTGTHPTGPSSSANIGIPGQCGCTDPLACNFDGAAVVDNGTCVYSVANDLCAGAISLGGATTTISVDNTAACQNEGILVPETGCNVTNGWCLGEGDEESSVWYTFTTPAADAQVTITTFDNGSGTVDTQIAVYEGGCGGTLVGANDDGNPPGFMSELIFACGTLLPNTTYTLLIDGYAGDSGVFGLDLIIDEAACLSGCTDVTACNYSATAVIDDGSCEYTSCAGCTNATACNYDAAATIDDGSCCFNICVNINVTAGSFPAENSWTFTDGLGNVLASGAGASSADLCLTADCGYDFNMFDSFGDSWNGATYTITVNGVVTYTGAHPTGPSSSDATPIGLASGCTDAGACNYDAAAICDDGSCEYTSCVGCTDMTACNYSAAATIDDGSCCYANCVSIVVTGGSFPSENSWTFTDGLGNVVASGAGASGATLCIVDDCYNFNMFDSFGDTWNGASYTITINGVATYTGAHAGGASSTVQTPVGLTLGCTDATACNYDMAAGCDDGSCTYPGCMDATACNYDMTAGCDDGSCTYPGCTDVTACNYDMTAGCDDGSCTYAPCIANDIPGGATALMVTPLGTCNPMMDDLTGASDSPESPASGADLWYAVTAVTPGLRVEVLDVNPQDLKIDLLDAALNPVDAEDVVAGNGGEALNYGGLTTGATYYISVSGSTGAFSICAQWIQDSQCDYGSGPYDLCATFKSNWIGAAGYAFEFTSQTTFVTYSYEKAAALQPSTFMKLSDAGLLWGDSYDVNCLAFYNLTNGAGTEKVYIQSDNVCSITVNASPTMVLRPSDNCANFGPHLLGQTIAGQPFVCGAIDYEWEFTRTDVAELPIYKLRGAANRFIQLLTVPGLTPGGVYDVRVRPIFSTGPGAFGAADCISIVGVVVMETQNGPVTETEANRVDVSGMEAGLYPNPNNGSMITINLTGVTSEVVNVDVMDQTGRVVFAAQYTVNDGSLNGVITFDQQLAGGLYLMKFTMDGESRTERFVVTR